MLLIGEGFDDSSDEVRGAVVQVRAKRDKIAIWTGNSSRKSDIMAIGYVCVCGMCVCVVVHVLIN